MELRGKRALITGGGTGVGRGIALALATAGCKVGITGRRTAMLQETAALWQGQPSILFFAADVTNRDEVKRLFDWAATEFGPLDILVNSAGANIRDRAASVLSPEDFDKLMNVNCTGAFNTIWAVLPQMRARREGLIVNINSVAGKTASSLAGVAYSASKFALAGLGSGIALEEAEHGIRVTNIYPGEVNTPLLDERPQPVSDARKDTALQPEDLAAIVTQIARLPPRAHVTEVVIKPTIQEDS